MFSFFVLGSSLIELTVWVETLVSLIGWWVKYNNPQVELPGINLYNG